MIYRFRRGWFGRLILQQASDACGPWKDARYSFVIDGMRVELHMVGTEKAIRADQARIALYEKRAAAARKGRAKKKEAV